MSWCTFLFFCEGRIAYVMICLNIQIMLLLDKPENYVFISTIQVCVAAYDGGNSWHQLPMLGLLKTTVTLSPLLINFYQYLPLLGFVLSIKQPLMMYGHSSV